MAEDLKLENALGSKVDVTAARFAANRAAMVALLGGMRAEEAKIREGGGAKAAEAQRAKGRLTVRERLALLLDPVEEGSVSTPPFAQSPQRASALVGDPDRAKDGAPESLPNFLELGLWAAHGMYEEFGGAPGAGVVTGLGRVSGRLCMIVANDATVKAGAFFPMTAKKVLRAQTIALENRIPTLYLVDSAGVFLPLQEDVFPDTDDFGRVFRNNAVMSSLGVPQITAIMGMCVAGGAYLPVMTDTVLMTEGSGLFLAGPSLVQAAIGQKTGAEELGGASMHSEISGTVDFKEPNDYLCIARLRSLVGKLGQRQGVGNREQGTASRVQGVGMGEVFSRVAFDEKADAPKYA